MSRPTIHERATFLGDVVFAADDGIITTFAVVAGAFGASLSSSVVIILGFANLFADALSMASGHYLGVKSEIDYQNIFNLGDRFLASALLVAGSLFGIGAIRATLAKKNIISGGIEVLAIGGMAAVIAYFVGILLGKYVIV